MNGYEYEIVDVCKHTGRPFVAPIAWTTTKTVRPYYPTCTCCKKK